MRQGLVRLLLFASLALSACDCQSSVLLIQSQDGPGGSLGDGGTSGSDAGDASVVCDPNDPARPRCSGHVCLCANCLDDDGDGLVDSLDPECAGALDDDEATYGYGFTSSPGKNCDDCYWDGNSGSGNDDCSVSTQCSITGSPANGSCATCSPSAGCVSRCLAATPNGCDCFGCCEVFDAAGAAHHVRLVSTCTAATLGDPTACPACLPNAACRNPCGRCELCAGKTLADLPADCGGAAACDAPSTPCEADGTCAAGGYCSFGCCLTSLL